MIGSAKYMRWVLLGHHDEAINWGYLFIFYYGKYMSSYIYG